MINSRYIGDVGFEKVAGTDLPHSIIEWDSKIITKVIEEHPYVTDGSKGLY
jgi:hypothetical protein